MYCCPETKSKVRPKKKDALGDNWRRWKQRFELYMIASGKNEKSDEVKTATLLHLAGPDALEVYNTFSFESPGDEKKLQKVLVNLMPLYPAKERHVGAARVQHKNPTAWGNYRPVRDRPQEQELNLVTSLRASSKTGGVVSEKNRSCLLRHADLTLATALDICRADEATASQMKSMSSAAACAVTPTDKAEVKPLRMKRNKPPKPGKQQECGYCGGSHRPYQKCPARGSECLKRGQRNHFASDMLLGAIDRPGQKDWSTTVTINSQNIRFKLDTGAQCNVMSL